MLGAVSFSKLVKNVVNTYYVVAPALVVSAMAMVVFGISDNLIINGICTFIIGIGISFNFITVQSYLNQSDATDKTRITGLYAFFFAMGFAIMIILGPILFSLANLIAFVVSSLFLLLVAILVIRFKISLKRIVVKKQKVSLSIFLVLALGGFLYGYIENAIVIMYPIYLVDLVSIELIGIIVSSYGLGGIVGLIPLIGISEKIGIYKACILFATLSFITFGISILITMSFHDLPFVLATGVLVLISAAAGAFVGVIYPITLAGLNDVGLNQNGIIYATSVYTFLYSLGSSTGPAFSGVSMDVFGRLGFFYTCMVLFIIFIVLCVSKGFKKDNAISVT